jgi:hypothetical protein
VRGLRAHVASDAQALTSYRLLATTAADYQERQLLEMIAANKHRLLDLLHEMLNGQALPPPTLPTDEVSNQKAVVRALIRHEHERGRCLRDLARQEPTVEGGLYALLLEMMAGESEMHARVLHIVLNRLNGTLRQPACRPNF